VKDCFFAIWIFLQVYCNFQQNPPLRQSKAMGSQDSILEENRKSGIGGFFSVKGRKRNDSSNSKLCMSVTVCVCVLIVLSFSRICFAWITKIFQLAWIFLNFKINFIFFVYFLMWTLTLSCGFMVFIHTFLVLTKILRTSSL